MCEHCRGCIIKIDGTSCPYESHNKEGKCPCTECLVKVTCDKICVDYERYSTDARNIREAKMKEAHDNTVRELLSDAML